MHERLFWSPDNREIGRPKYVVVEGISKEATEVEKPQGTCKKYVRFLVARIIWDIECLIAVNSDILPDNIASSDYQIRILANLVVVEMT